MISKLENYLANLCGITLFAIFIKYTAPYVGLIQIFKDAPYPAQALIMFAFALIFFIILMGLKVRILKDGVVTKNEKRAWYAVGVPFLTTADIPLNVVFAPLFLFGSVANSFNEGWTFTAHCKAIKECSFARLEDMEKLTWLEMRRFRLALFYCRLMSSVDRGHC